MKISLAGPMCVDIPLGIVLFHLRSFAGSSQLLSGVSGENVERLTFHSLPGVGCDFVAVMSLG